MKPTTRLLVTVMICSLVIALVVAGTSVGLSWANSMTVTKDTLKKELSIVLRAVHSFTVNQARQTLVFAQYNLWMS